VKCFLCGRNRGGINFLAEHHIFGNSNRKHSEKYGLKVLLCNHDCHIYGPKSAHKNKDTAQMLHEYGQRKFMREQSASIADFVKIFGKNYLDEEW